MTLQDYDCILCTSSSALSICSALLSVAKCLGRSKLVSFPSTPKLQRSALRAFFHENYHPHVLGSLED
jgi:hypothetical protein